MKNTILVLSLLFFCMQCNSQKPEKNTNPILEEQSSRTADDDYFVGNWMKSKIFVNNAEGRKLQSQDRCSQKSYWKFAKVNKILKQSKFTAKGKNCETFISTTFGNVVLENNQMNYFVDDVLYSVKIQIISDDEFVLEKKDFISGKMVQVEEIFEKIK